MGGARRQAAGMGGQLTGKGADTLLWDDLLKPADANSDRKRTLACTWLGETFRSRLNNQRKGVIIGIMQRLHELDPTGYLLERSKIEGADKWLHVKIEMECPRPRVYSYGEFFKSRAADELLHPERVGPKEIASLKVDLGNNFEGQCNQNPIKMKGSYYQLDWFNYYEGAPPELSRVYEVWDYALTEEAEEAGDFSVRIRFGLTTGGQLYITDVYRAKVNSVDLVDKTMQSAIEAKALAIFGAKGPIDKAIRPWLTKRMQETGVFFRLEGIAETVDLLERSTPFQSMCRAGAVYLPKHARWLADFKLEMSAVPRGAHDDMAAACFPAGTLVLTRDGNIPIETITTGDDVWTTRGWRRVTASAYTGQKKVTRHFGICATPDHPIYVHGIGFVPLADLQPQHMLHTCSIPGHSSSMESGSLDTRTRSAASYESIIGHIESGKRRRSRCTDTSTQSITDRSQPGITSTTRTTTRSTTLSRIWRAVRCWSIGALIRCLPQRAHATANISAACAPPEGEPPWPHGHSIDSPVGSAKRRFGVGTLTRCTADRFVDREVAVYNISVEDAQEYFANGVRVHNCALIGLALPMIRAGEVIPRHVATTGTDDRNDIDAVAIRKVLGRAPVPAAERRKMGIAEFARQRVLAGRVIVDITAEDYHTSVRQMLVGLIKLEADAGRANTAAIAAGELGRFDRKFKVARESLPS